MEFACKTTIYNSSTYLATYQINKQTWNIDLRNHFIKQKESNFRMMWDKIERLFWSHYTKLFDQNQVGLFQRIVIKSE